LVQPAQIDPPLLDARASCRNSENCIRSFLLLARSSARSMSGVKASQPMASPKVPPMASQKLIILSMITYRDLLYEKPLAALQDGPTYVQPPHPFTLTGVRREPLPATAVPPWRPAGW